MSASKQDKDTYYLEELFSQDIPYLYELPIQRGIRTFRACVDRGVTCWKMFLVELLKTFPDLELIEIEQDYSLHDYNCDYGHKAESTPDIVGPFKESTIKRLVVVDCQSDFPEMKNKNEFTLEYEGRHLKITRQKGWEIVEN